MLSGNLNFSVPLLAAQGRAGWKVPLGLSYNSQNWRQDGGANWRLGGDVGYGFGWRMAFGSITPYYANWTAGVDHYIFTDGSGAEYNLRVNNGGIWTSQESIYLWFDANTNVLHLKDGTSWVMGCTSGGAEEDAGALYPTIIRDVHGNQVIVSYAAGVGLGNTNTSSRIAAIYDARTPGDNAIPQIVYNFVWNSMDSLYIKALGAESTKDFDMNFQQVKPACCDVFIWVGVWRDKIRYWVLASKEVANDRYYAPGQHRGNVG